MAEPVARVGRRRMLSGLAIFGLGAAGGGAIVGAAARSDDTTGDPAAAAPARRTMVLTSARITSTVPGRVAGELRPSGQPPATGGDVVDADGSPAGRFHSAAVPGSAGALMVHTFELTDGNILGMGSGPLAEATYAVVGGTGRYRGATGSYLARQRPRDLGGDGTAEFVIDITTEGN